MFWLDYRIIQRMNELLASVSLGVVAIEKHFIINHKIKSNDSLFSIDKKQMNF